MKAKIQQASEELKLLRVMRIEGVICVTCSNLDADNVVNTMQAQLEKIVAYSIPDGVIPKVLVTKAREVCDQAEAKRSVAQRAVTRK